MRTKPLFSHAFVVAWLVIAGTMPSPVAASDAVVRVDLRVELCAVMCRLADYKEYQTRGIANYDRAVEEHFRPFTNHPTIAVMRKLQAKHQIGYNAPMALALVADAETFQPRAKLDPIPSWLDKRWTPSSAKEFLAAMAKFAADTKAREFFAGQSVIHRAAESNLTETLLPRLDLSWFARQYGPMTNTSFCIIPGLLDGPQNYGVEVRLSDGRREIYGVMATPVFAEGEPIKYPVAQLLELIVHEFSHSFVNPWVDAHARQLDPSGSKIFKVVASEMKSQAYGTARVMLYESVESANTIRYFQDHGETASARHCIATDCRQNFFWTEPLADVFGDAGDGASRLDAARSAIQEFFETWGRAPAEKIAAVKSRLETQEKARLAKGPQILKAIPANGDQQVEVGLSILELHFDRQMLAAVSIFGDVPEVTGKPAWDTEKRVLRIPVKLEAGRTYQLQLNNSEKPDDGFRSAASEPLAWQQWRFKVR